MNAPIWLMNAHFAALPIFYRQPRGGVANVTKSISGGRAPLGGVGLMSSTTCGVGRQVHDVVESAPGFPQNSEGLTFGP